MEVEDPLMLNGFKLTRNFALHEFESPDTHEVKIIPELVLLLQKVRDRIGKPIQITSGYRTPEHNRAVGGAKASYHMKGMAADIICWKTSRFDLARICFEAGFPCIILYPDKPHVHVDIREEFKGIVVDVKGKLIPYSEYKGKWKLYRR